MFIDDKRKAEPKNPFGPSQGNWRQGSLDKTAVLAEPTGCVMLVGFPAAVTLTMFVQLDCSNCRLTGPDKKHWECCST